MAAWLAVAAVALIGLWCVVVIPALWVSGTMSQQESDGPVAEDDGEENLR